MNCKIGDLAFVIGGAFTENLGKIVEIVGPGRTFGSWQVEPRTGPLKGNNVETGEPGWSTDTCGPIFGEDQYLKPIKGLRPDEIAELTRKDKETA